MPSSAFPSPAVTAASRCCSASAQQHRAAGRPGGRAAFYLARSLPPRCGGSGLGFLLPLLLLLSSELLQLLVFLLPTAKDFCQLIQQKSGPMAAPGEGWGTDWAPGGPSSPPGPWPCAGGCQRQRTRPKGAYAEHSRARRELKTSVRQ